MTAKTQSSIDSFMQELNALRNSKKRCIAIIVFSFLFVVSCILPNGISQGIAFTVVSSLLAAIPLALLTATAICAVNSLHIAKLRTPLGLSGKVFCFSFAALTIWWGITAFPACYPGICTVDTQDIFKMIFGLPFESNHFRYDTLNNHHPAFYVFLISIPLNLASVLGLSEPIAIGIVALLHMISLSICCSFVQSKLWLMTRSRLFCALAFCFFLLNPLIMLYSVTLWKDVVFAGFFLVFLAELIALITARKKFYSSPLDIAALAISALLCVLLRNNAIVVIGVTAAVLAIYMKGARKVTISLFTSVLLIAAIVVGPVYEFCNVKPGHFSESISIPLQQISKTAATEGAAITEAQYEYLNELLPYEQYVERYDAGTSNPIKFSPEFNDEFLEDDKGAFFSTWLKMGVRNPSLYLRAWIDQTRAFWDPTYKTWYIGTPGYSLDGGEPVHRNLTEGLITYEQLAVLLEVTVAIFSPLFNSALLAWFVLFALLVLLYRKERGMAICLMPLILWWITFLIAAPAGDFRYMFPVHLALPLVFLLLFYFPSVRHSK